MIFIFLKGCKNRKIKEKYDSDVRGVFIFWFFYRSLLIFG